MVLYESHSVIHGRPFPMIGNFFANCFIHFEPYAPLEGEAHDPNSDIPPYIVEDSVWENEWKIANPDGWKFVSIVLPFFLCSKFVSVFVLVFLSTGRLLLILIITFLFVLPEKE